MLSLSQSLRLNPADLPPEDVIFGTTPRMQEVRKTIERIAETDLPVLIRGETGTGKEIVARYLHLKSRQKNAPFVELNCAAIPVHLLESELLGYEKGAFTGATESKPGLVEIANGGTLFLDEIGDMESSLQAKLLHLLQDGRYARLGGHEDRHARVRIVCATNSDLESAVRARTFRLDLLYRINVICLHLIPLRERKQDLQQLCDFLLLKLSRKVGVERPALSSTVLHLLSELNWPGNIRELESWVMRDIVLGVREAVGAELDRHVRLAITLPLEEDGLTALKETSRRSVKAAERAIIVKRLENNQWNRRQTAKDLNISYRSLLYKLRDAGVPGRRDRSIRVTNSSPKDTEPMGGKNGNS